MKSSATRLRSSRVSSLRAVFGARVRQLLETYEDIAGFYGPDVCFGEAQEYIPDVAKRRAVDSSLALTVLEEVSRIVVSVDRSLYEGHEKLARERIQRRDPDDWPVVAVALMLGIPVRTEDQDFFGSGIPTWTTDRVELYLRGSA